MVRGLDMALDEIVRESRRNGGKNGNFEGRGRRLGPGPDHLRLNRPLVRATPYPVPQQMQQGHAWQQQFVPVGNELKAELGTKLYISNLDYDVSNEDIRGTAEVIFCRQGDALAAIRRYNDVELDGRPMQIEIVGANLTTPAPLQVAPAPFTPANVIPLGPYGRFRANGQERGYARLQGHGHFYRGEVRNEGKKITAEELDADLDEYRSEASKATERD